MLEQKIMDNILKTKMRTKNKYLKLQVLIHIETIYISLAQKRNKHNICLIQKNIIKIWK